MQASDRTAEFVDNGNAPEFFANGLHDVEVMGPVSRFVLFVVRRTPGGVLYREPSFTCVMPNEAIGPAIALTIKKASVAIAGPVAGHALKAIFRGRAMH